MSYASSSCYVTLCTPAEALKLHEKLKGNSYTLDTPPFTRFRARKEGLSCTVYLSGKVLIQGRDLAQFLELFFPAAALQNEQPPVKASQEKKQLLSEKQVAYRPCMGFDESGKGDVFGPLCLAGVYVGENQNTQLIDWGVCDSKKLSDAQILSLAAKIRKAYLHEQLVLMPERYNALYLKFRNLNRLLAWGHVEIMSALYAKSGCPHAVLDQFCSPHEVETLLKRKQLNIALIQRTRAESSEIAVAAGSILARACFVEGMEELARYCGFPLPKGATHGMVQVGKKVLHKYGEEGLSKTIKLHFKTLTAIRE